MYILGYKKLSLFFRGYAKFSSDKKDRHLKTEMQNVVRLYRKISVLFFSTICYTGFPVSRLVRLLRHDSLSGQPKYPNDLDIRTRVQLPKLFLGSGYPKSGYQDPSVLCFLILSCNKWNRVSINFSLDPG